jgi:hypothetical protein
VKLTRRKITLQLTPLLDLMLIVFFLQYMQLREREMTTVNAAATAEQDVARLRNELAESLAKMDESTAMARRDQAAVGDLTRANIELRDQLAASVSRVKEQAEREKTLGSLVVDLFKVPQADVEKVLDPQAQPGVQRTPQDVSDLRKKFQQMAAQKPDAMIRHLLLYEEIRKRCDVWELFIDSQNVVLVNTGGPPRLIRLNLNDEGEPDVARFEEEFFQLYRSLPEPKSLVVVLLTYDRETRLIVSEAVEKALPQLTRRLSDDARGAVRFEYADLGIRDPG